MTERTPWWKAFLPKKKSGSKEPSLGPDFDPWAQRGDKAKEPAHSAKTDATVAPDAQRGSSLLSDDTFDDTQVESVFNEKTCRRNMTVSRSGRFKEKRRNRQSLLQITHEEGKG
uniref:Proline-rich protein 15 n=1 Tax=Neogobius melanostomus TaxID=47308 RepID=A0A8C6T595_9GOBI